MAILNRMTRLVRADFNAVLDSIEEPQVLLAESIREMEAALTADRTEATRLVFERAELERGRTALGDKLARLATELDVCFESQADDLARSLIRRRLQTEAAAEDADAKLQSLAERIATLRDRTTENAQRLNLMRDRAAVVMADADEVYLTTNDGPITDDEVEIAFLRERHARGVK